jgi:N-acetylglucosaminyl-diphospho-decaprenol L-rhamnosyltransferase
MDNIRIRVVIVNYNTKEALIECLESVLNSELFGIDLQIHVIDNNSKDDSMIKAEKLFENNGQLTFVRNNDNLGFAKACNIGADNFSGDLLLFLNPDCFVESDVIQETSRYILQKENESIGVLGIKLLDEYGQATTSHASFPTNWNLFYSTLGLDKILPSYFKPVLQKSFANEIMVVDQIMGSFYLIKVDVFNRVGSFDERFFVYYEEVDLSYRLRMLGYNNVCFPKVFATHLGGHSSEQFSVNRLYYSLKSRWKYWRKHMRSIDLIIYLVIFVMEFFSRIFHSIVRCNFRKISEILSSYILLLKNSLYVRQK